MKKEEFLKNLGDNPIGKKIRILWDNSLEIVLEITSNAKRIGRKDYYDIKIIFLEEEIHGRFSISAERVNGNIKTLTLYQILKGINEEYVYQSNLFFDEADYFSGRKTEVKFIGFE